MGLFDIILAKSTTLRVKFSTWQTDLSHMSEKTPCKYNI